jgi:hypothetical protein
MKTKIRQMTVTGDVGKSTVLFAHALMCAGVNVRSVQETAHHDVIDIQGLNSYNVELWLYYETDQIEAMVYHRSGFQYAAQVRDIHSYRALKNLFKVWNIAN